jgi:hypothetical protein
MKVLHCEGWSQYDDTVEAILDQHGRPEFDGKRREVKVLYRGQSDASWGLTTTLERTNCEDLTIENYMNTAYSVASDIEGMTNYHWDLEDLEENLELVRHGEHGLIPRILSYPYLIYLRHHGFPSPLLDWTMSPWVAAFFAFERDKETEMVSVFMFIEHPRFGKSTIDRDVNIHTYKHGVKTHCRHYAQLCQYTVATKQENGLMTFCPHAEVFSRNREDQDLLIKIEIPHAARIDALAELKEKKVTREWLFQPEDVLIGMLAEMHYGGFGQ